MDLIVRNARLMSGDLTDIGSEDGFITALEPDLERSATRELDAAGRLVLPAFVNGQLHACKAFWRRKLAEPPSPQAPLRFRAARGVKAAYTPEDVAARAGEAVRLAVLNGTCGVRLFADVDETAGLQALEGLLRVRTAFSPFMTVQVVAFPQDGFSDRTAALMEEAMERGADVVGGIPWTEPDEAAQHAHVDRCFALAETYGKPLHLVCDDTTDPASRTLEVLARRTLERNFKGQVAATQCAALAFYSDAHAAEVVTLVKRAGLTVFSNAHVSLVTTPRRGEPYPRGLTRVAELLGAGVPVACAQDDIDNPYYPFGRNDMLEVAHYMTHAGGFGWEPERVLPMVTTTPARALGLPDYGLDVGTEVNLVVLDATSWHAALQFAAPKTAVVLRGRLAARTVYEQRLELPGF